MARPRKRKHAGSAKHRLSDGPPSKRARIEPDAAPAPAAAQTQHAVLNQYYSRVLTLRDYVVSSLPPSSRIRRKKIAAVGTGARRPSVSSPDVARSLGALLDTTLIGVPALARGRDDAGLDAWKDFSQKQRGDESTVTLSNGIDGFVESQALIIDYVVQTLFSRQKSALWPKHLLCDGHRRHGGLGIRSIRPNPHVEALQRCPWPHLLALLGESGDGIMINMLLECAIFVTVDAGAGNMLQISGKPLSELEPYRCEVVEKKPQTLDVKYPSELVFVRNRMLYARAALNARGLVHFGLRHINVLNRSPYHHLEESILHPIEKEEQVARQNAIHTLKVSMYMFPRQFGLHNVFTSKVNLKETAQRLKDYTLREEEIAERFGRLGDTDSRVSVPKRLRGQAMDLVRRFQIQHRRCSYSKLLQHLCPTHSTLHRARTGDKTSRKSQQKTRYQHSKLASQRRPNAEVPLTELATPPDMVSAFCQAALSKVVPRAFWGQDPVAEHNEGVFLKNVHRFICLRRFEGMSLQEAMQGIKIAEIGWLAPPRLLGAKTSKTDMQKRLELFSEFLYFLFDSLVIPLIRSNFYVTESNIDKYRLFFFRHDIWRSLVEPAMVNLKGKMFEEVNITDALRILNSRQLGFSQVRLLPKGNGMRPIMNLRRRVAKRGNTKELGPGINKLLAPVHTVLQLEKVTNPQKLGSTLFSVGDIYQRIKRFKSKMEQYTGRFYFAKVDVQSAFDTIPQAAIVGLLNSIPQQGRYGVSKFLEVVPGIVNQGMNLDARSKPIKRWPSVAFGKDDTSTLRDLLESGRVPTKRNSVFVDLWKKHHETSELLQMVASHIQQNLVKVGKKFYRQKEGIPQGSVLSATLCNYFYADLEVQALPFLEADDSLLLRLIDDFLLITTDREKAGRFVNVLHAGVPEYGVKVNPRKTLVNFDIEIGGQRVTRLDKGRGFPYCGTLIDCGTLEISRDRDRGKDAAIYNSLSVEFTRLPGQTFQRKVLNAFKIQSHLMFFDTGLNSATTMLRNLHAAFVETATKMWAYARCLPAQKQPSAALVNRTISKLVNVAYLLLVSKTRRRRFPGYVCDVKKCEVSWLAYDAFQKVLARRQSRYAGTLRWLRAETDRLSLLRDVRHGRMRHVVI